MIALHASHLSVFNILLFSVVEGFEFMVMVFVKNLSDSDLPETYWEDCSEVVCTVTLVTLARSCVKKVSANLLQR